MRHGNQLTRRYLHLTTDHLDRLLDWAADLEDAGELEAGDRDLVLLLLEERQRRGEPTLDRERILRRWTGRFG